MSATHDLASAGLVELGALFAAHRASPSEALHAHFARIDARNNALNALVHLDREGATAAAERASARWASGAPLSPIDGMAIAVKANIAVAGAPWTAGFRAFADRIAARDALIVARLRAAGAIIIGIANMHEGALGATTDGPLYGKAYNPIGEGLTPGGSSGGSAAAAAAGFCAAALGSDTLGSVRIPAAYCGNVGFKPTFGRLPRSGVELLSWSLDHVGVQAHAPRDAALVLAVGGGLDADDPWSDERAAPPMQSSLAGLRVGRLDCDAVVIEPEIGASFEQAMDALARAGAQVSTVSLGAYDFARARRVGLLIAEAEAAAMLGATIARDPDGFSSGFRQAIDYGAKQSAARLAEAQHLMWTARGAARQAFAVCDVLALPTAPHTAFAHTDPAPASQADLTALANLIGAPAIAIPMGAGRAGLPVSLQLVAPPGADEALLHIAQAFCDL